MAFTQRILPTHPIKAAAVFFFCLLRLISQLGKLAGMITEAKKKDTHAHDAAVADTELSLRLNNLCLQVLSRIVCTSVRYSRVSHPKADTASGISNSGSHCMAPFGHYSMTFLNCLSAMSFLKYNLSFLCQVSHHCPASSHLNTFPSCAYIF